jgi:hypothetical protein
VTGPAPDLTDEQREALLRNVAEVYAAFNRFARALRPQIEAAARTFAELGQQLQAAGLIDADGNPTQPRDRPAWQTPYGPATRRRR